jgi:hypothetical protein
MVKAAEMFPRMGSHEMLGYGDANTETRYGNVMFSAYMKHQQQQS